MAQLSPLSPNLSCAMISWMGVGVQNVGHNPFGVSWHLRDIALHAIYWYFTWPAANMSERILTYNTSIDMVSSKECFVGYTHCLLLAGLHQHSTIAAVDPLQVGNLQTCNISK